MIDSVAPDLIDGGPQCLALHEALGSYAGECGVVHLFVRGRHAELTAQGGRSAGIEDVQVIDIQEDMANSIIRCAGPGDLLLVKGSRGMMMEKVIEHLRRLYDEPARAEAASKQAQGM